MRALHNFSETALADQIDVILVIANVHPCICDVRIHNCGAYTRMLCVHISYYPYELLCYDMVFIHFTLELK